MPTDAFYKASADSLRQAQANGTIATGFDASKLDPQTAKYYNNTPLNVSSTPTYYSSNTSASSSSPTTSTSSTSTTPTVTDNSAQIQQMYQQQKDAALSALKQAISQNVSAQQDTINKAPQTYQPLRDQVSANGYANLNALKEMLANQGQQGGVNRTETTAVNSATENDINKLNLQQQNVIDTANKTIADLEASGNLQQAQLVAQNASDKIKALIDESNRIAAANYAQSQDAIRNAQNDAALTGVYNGQSTLAAKNAADSNAMALAQLLGHTSTGEQTQAAKDAQSTQALNLAQLLGYTSNGTQTLAAKNADQNNALNLAQLLGYTSSGQQTLAGKQADASIANTNAQTAYQNLVNAGYPQEQAMKMAQAQASITGQNLQNDYQTLVNAGYPAQQAAQLAQMAASTNATNSSAARSSSSGGGLSSTDLNAQKYQDQQNTQNLINQVTSSIYDKIYGQNSTAGALNTLTQNKSGILHDLTAAGMNSKDALSYWQSMYQDLSGQGGA